MAADEFIQDGPVLPDRKKVVPGNPGDDCPRCNQAQMTPFSGKLRCPACMYLQGCCDPA